MTKGEHVGQVSIVPDSPIHRVLRRVEFAKVTLATYGEAGLYPKLLMINVKLLTGPEAVLQYHFNWKTLSAMAA